METEGYLDVDVAKCMAEKSNILDFVAREEYKPIYLPTRRRVQLAQSNGRFCVAFHLENGSKQLCYRVWKKLIPDALERYKLIDRRLSAVRLKYFANFRYVPQALKMDDGVVLPGIAMDWIDGKSLDTFLKVDWRGLTEDQRLEFIREFYLMCYTLRDHGIAHGDLSCKNILVTPGRKISLVDYDSLYVREMGGKYYQITGGAPGFQHPERIEPTAPLRASIDDDNFSQLVIALSLWVAYLDVDIVSKYDESNLLFIPSDLKDWRSLRESGGWKSAARFMPGYSHIEVLMEALERGIQGPLLGVSSLLNFASLSKVSSADFYSILSAKIKMMDFCTCCGNIFKYSDFKYCTVCGAARQQYK